MFPNLFFHFLHVYSTPGFHAIIFIFFKITPPPLDLKIWLGMNLHKYERKFLKSLDFLIEFLSDLSKKSYQFINFIMFPISSPFINFTLILLVI